MITHSPLSTPLRCAHTPDPDDAFAWWALTTGRVAAGDRTIDLTTEPIQAINEKCLQGEYDIAAISSAAWPWLQDDYVILGSGASVGRGYGPSLATKSLCAVSDLDGALVAIPGELTTGALLLRLFFPGVRTVELPFDKIAQAILNGVVDAGVLIHEELLNWETKGLRELACLGATWMRDTGLPIPVGVNVAHRRLGTEGLRQAEVAVHQSMVLANMHPDDARAWAMRYSMECAEGIGEAFIGMFANDDTLEMPQDCLQALDLLYQRAFNSGLIPVRPEVAPLFARDVNSVNIGVVVDHESQAECAVDRLRRPGLRHRTLVDATMGSRELSLWEDRHLPGFSVAPHRHQCEEIITVLEGNLEIAVNRHSHLLGPNQSLHIPAGAAHALKVLGTSPVRMLSVFGSSQPKHYDAGGRQYPLPWEQEHAG